MNNCNRQMNRTASPVQMPYMNQPAFMPELAMAYVPWQHFRELYEPDQAFQCGTVFKELYKPFTRYSGGRS